MRYHGTLLHKYVLRFGPELSVSLPQATTDGCQSNCVLNPSPPGGGSPTPILQNKVIGYYESWSARKKCHQIAPTDLPLDALTQSVNLEKCNFGRQPLQVDSVNFAFASIEPGSYKVVTMDTSTPSGLFQDTANLKSVKPDLVVFVSIGGW